MKSFLFCNKVLFFPLVSLLSFLVFTELFFFIGPQIYDVPSKTKLFLFLGIVNVALYLGYKKGVQKYRIKEEKRYSISFVKKCMCFAFLLFPLRVISLWGINSFSPIAIFFHLKTALLNPALVYSSKLELISSPITYLTIILSPLIYLSLSLCVTEFDRFNAKFKIGAVLLFVSEVVLSLGQGVRKGVLDVILILLFLSIAKFPHLLSIRNNKRYFFIVIVVILSFLSYFIYSNMSRYGVDDMSLLLNEGSIYAAIKNEYRDLHPMLLVPICSFQGYLCQGYRALGYALDADFTFTYGLGSSWFGLNLMNRFGLRLLPYTYVGQLEKIGIDPMINWHSIYTWLATDLTFWGVPIFIYFMGYYLATTWLDTIYRRNLYSSSVLVLFVIMTFYSFANNQVFSLSFIAFFVLFYLWKINR